MPGSSGASSAKRTLFSPTGTQDAKAIEAGLSQIHGALEQMILFSKAGIQSAVTVAELEGSVLELKRQVEAKGHELTSLTARFDELYVNNEEGKAKLKRAISSEEVAKQDKLSLERQVAKLSAEVSHAKTLLKRAVDQMKQQAAVEAAKGDGKVQELQRLLEATRADQMRVAQDLGASKVEVAALNADLSASRDSNLALQEKLSIMQASFDEIQSVAEERRRENSGLQLELAQMKASISEVASLKDANFKLRSQISVFRRQLEQIQALQSALTSGASGAAFETVTTLTSLTVEPEPENDGDVAASVPAPAPAPAPVPASVTASAPETDPSVSGGSEITGAGSEAPSKGGRRERRKVI
ncbi:hypothetical protein EBR96_07115 [bacterium]|nr:hypothetical protein [bacterium]